MRLLPLAASSFVALSSVGVSAATYYVSPTGTATSVCLREDACSLSAITPTLVAGDTVILTDGVYKENIHITASGTPDKWITFQAEECATPILEGPGSADDMDKQIGGVQAVKTDDTLKAEYLRFVGIVARGWNTGFGNSWTDKVYGSNGHIEYKNCIGYGNSRTGFSFFSAEGIHISNCISANNGSSTKHSWSSGISLLQVHGGADVNIVENTISFENMDGQGVPPPDDNPSLVRHSDGSGFIVDEDTQGATFRNNLAFRNGGSCFRLTKSTNTRFINNTCYHNALDPQAEYPGNPGELYFTRESGTNPVVEGVTFANNILVAHGLDQRSMTPVNDNKPSKGWSKNIETVGAASYFTDPEGMHPDFTLKAASASNLIGKGDTVTGAPMTDLGFDPKCIVKKDPVMVGQIGKGSWWHYSVDIDYIKSIGGVTRCWNPKTRSAPLDIGAYAAAGFSAVTTPLTCPKPVPPSPPLTAASSAPTAGATTAGSGVTTGGSSSGASATTTSGTTAGNGVTTGGSTAGSTGLPSNGTPTGSAVLTNSGVPAGTTSATPSGGSPSSAGSSADSGCAVSRDGGRRLSNFAALSGLGLALFAARRRNRRQ